MECQFLGSEAAGPTLRLDHEEFAYAGKFVMSSTGKTVACDDGTLVGAVAFSADSTDPTTVRLRYVTVREDRRGEGIGPRLLRFSAERLREGYDTVEIAVNNPIAYEACYRAGFGYTGEQAGIAELRMAYGPNQADGEQYRSGFTEFRERDLPPAHDAICDRYENSDPPAVVDLS
jgi:GNAT superfamily N-acetyltransferase